MGAHKLNNNSDKLCAFQTSYVLLTIHPHASMPKISVFDMRRVFKKHRIATLFLSDWYLEMETLPLVAQYTWQPSEYKKSISKGNEDMRF